MKRLLLGSTLALGLLATGCGSGSSGVDTGASTSGTSPSTAAVAPATTTSTVVADSAPPGEPPSPSLRAFEGQSTVSEGPSTGASPRPVGTAPTPVPGPTGAPTPSGSPRSYSLPLHPGWNPVAFQCSRVLSVQKPPEILGYAFYDGNGYPTGPLDDEHTNNEDEGPRRGLWVFCSGACTLNYTGIDDNRGDFVKLRRGWNLVSFITASRIDGRALTALALTPEGPRPVPLNSVVLPQFFSIERDNGHLSIDVIEGGELEPGHCYWVYAAQECALVWGRPPVLPSPSPKPSPTATPPRPEPSPRPSPVTSPRPEPSPKASPEPKPSPTAPTPKPSPTEPVPTPTPTSSPHPE